MKRLFGILVSILGLVVSAPVIAFAGFLIWFQDFKSPFYLSERVGKDGKLFRMIKLRSMVVGADRQGASSTSADDVRITKIGHLIRKFKIDELPQLFNVLKGDMSIVGPRPNVMKNGVELYTPEEMRLLSVRPGITDIASIVYSNEAEILKGSKDPDGDYNRLIRPGKSRLGLYYVENCSIAIDWVIMLITIVSLFSRQGALQVLEKIIPSQYQQ